MSPPKRRPPAETEGPPDRSGGDDRRDSTVARGQVEWVIMVQTADPDENVSPANFFVSTSIDFVAALGRFLDEVNGR
jgi:hypothetical protein